MFFKNFPKVRYKFGDAEAPVSFRKLSTYVDVLDRVVNNISTYNKITIKDYDRPDTLAYQLYGKPEYYWTFFVMNENLREQGWPIPQKELLTFIKKAYPGVAVQLYGTLDVNSVDTPLSIFTQFPIYTDSTNTTKFDYTITGDTTLSGFTIDYINYDIGQIVFNRPSTLSDADWEAWSNNISSITWSNDGVSYATNVGTVFYAKTAEWLGTHHYENGDGENIVGRYLNDVSTEDGDTLIDPTDLSTANAYTRKTYYDYVDEQNTDLRQIKVIKPNLIRTIVSEYNRFLKG